MVVVIGVVTMGRFSYILATQAQYSRQMVEYSICQLQGSRPECIVQTAISNINIVGNILGVLATAGAPYLNILFPAQYSDFVKMANLLCCVCKRKWSCASSEEGSPREQNAAIG